MEIPPRWQDLEPPTGTLGSYLQDVDDRQSLFLRTVGLRAQNENDSTVEMYGVAIQSLEGSLQNAFGHIAQSNEMTTIEKGNTLATVMLKIGQDCIAYLRQTGPELDIYDNYPVPYDPKSSELQKPHNDHSGLADVLASELQKSLDDSNTTEFISELTEHCIRYVRIESQDFIEIIHSEV